jgi:hypothetical protein
MTFLHETVAILPGVEADHKAQLAALQNVLAVGGDQNPLTGLDRTHEPISDAFDKQPDQRRFVQLTTAGLLGQYADAATQFFDVQATREVGNTLAASSVEIDGHEILPAMPAGYLLFLEGQLTALLNGVIARLQIRDPGEEWHRDPGDPPGVYRAAERKRLSTGKDTVAKVGYDATATQPAQIKWIEQDVTTGTWTWVKYSGQLSMSEVYEIRKRAALLLGAVRAARQRANRIEVENLRVGRGILEYVFGDLLS